MVEEFGGKVGELGGETSPLPPFPVDETLKALDIGSTVGYNDATVPRWSQCPMFLLCGSLKDRWALFHTA